MLATKASTKRTSRYSYLSNIELIVDATGLATNTNNSYGQVDGSNNIVSLKSVSPGTTGRDFSVIGSGVTFDPTTKSIAFNGSGRLRSTGAATVYDFMSYNATPANLEWTAFMVVKMGNTVKPAPSTFYGLFGNNGASSANKGVSLNYGNTATDEDNLQALITKGTSGQYFGRLPLVGCAPSNQYCVVTMQCDGSGGPFRLRLIINDDFTGFYTDSSTSNTPVTTPTYAMEIGGCGNGVVPLTGNIKEFVIVSNLPTFLNLRGFIRTLMNKHGIVRSRSSDYLGTSGITHVFMDDNDAKYKLCGVISQDPNNPERVFSAYSKGSAHGYSADKKTVGRKSLYKGGDSTAAWDSLFDIYDPATGAVQDLGGGFDQNGVMHLFTERITSGGAGGCVEARHIYSSDLSSWTNTDITASLHSDGLAAWRMTGNMIHVNGVWIKGYYKATDQGDSTQSANYILRSTNGTTWTSIEVRAVGATYINEPTVFWAGGDNIGYLARNESTGEWSICMSGDLGLTWGSMSNITFGETVVTANPAMVKHFYHNGVLVNVAYITNRDNNTAFAIYGKASDIVSDPVNGWDLGTKIMWWKNPNNTHPTISTEHYHYGDVTHIDDTIKAVGIYPYDPYPPTGAATENDIQWVYLPTWHVSLIESQLGI